MNYIAISGYGWGRGATAAEARAKERSQRPTAARRKRKVPVQLFEAHPDTEVFGDGSWQYPPGHRPVKIDGPDSLQPPP